MVLMLKTCPGEHPRAGRCSRLTRRHHYSSSSEYPPTMATNVANGLESPTDPEDITAVRYTRGTAEWRILNSPLGAPPLRVRRANAHRPTAIELWKKAIQQSGKPVPNVDHTSHFRYSKLGSQEIRLLRLYQSKHPEDPLKADMFKRRLEDVKGQYEALSYCWGTGAADHEIQIRDLNATRAVVKTNSELDDSSYKWWETLGAITHTEFRIRKNLHDALKRLRRRHGDVHLWVDAICIDQTPQGFEEKGAQLAKMGRIYNTASSVAVWLGEDSGEASNAFRLAREIMNYRMFDDMIHDDKMEEAWRDLANIMQADWFSRRWIIQEIALSRNATIHCGEHSLHWDDFADAVSLLVEKIELMRVGFRDEVFDDIETSSASILIQTLGNICRKSDEKHDRGAIDSRLLDIETLVSTLLGFQASFPRDTIFSILSLAKDFPKSKEGWEVLHAEQIEKVKNVKLKRIKREWQRHETRKARLVKELQTEADFHARIESELRVLEQQKIQLIEAEEKGEEEEVQRLRSEIETLDEETLRMFHRDYKELEESRDRCELQVRQLVLKYRRTEDEVITNPVTLLPNYRFSPRDLFIAFVTRSIFQTKSLDIICRHWAPDLTRVEDGAGQMPSWISSRSRAAFGLPGTARGRQNGDNLVGYLPHDIRRRYFCSGSTEANIEMLLDPRLLDGDVATGPGPVEGAGPPPVETHVDQEAIQSIPPLALDERAVPFEGVAPVAGVAPVEGAAPVEGTTPVGMAAQVTASERGSIKTTGPRFSSLRRLGRFLPRFGSQLEKQSEEHRVQTQQSSLRGGQSSNVSDTVPPINTRDSTPEGAEQEPDSTGDSVPQETEQDAGRSGDAPLAPAARHGPGTTSTKQLVASSFPSASTWAPGPHQLSGILVVRGFTLGRIKSQSDVMRGGVIPGEWVSKLGWENDENNHVPDVLWRLLVADRMPNGARPPLWYKRACLHGLVDRKVSDNAGNIHPVTPVDRSISEMTSKYFRRVEAVVWSRRLFDLTPNDEADAGGVGTTTTASSKAPTASSETPTPTLYGLGPGGSSVGDLVCILYGCSVPVVLKVAERKRVENLFEVVGEAYVDGVTDGEFMKEKWTSTARDFRLC
ncbi:heterokaryon incompatibility protein-domain-containing protein [Podospora conica]|nr:heterokaryon incompatibility protein-domain-containing protein [Schizothecium conicum]